MNFEKTHLLLSKLKSPALEVQSRTLNTLFTKIQTNVLTFQDLLTSHFSVIGDLLAWINENQESNPLLEKVLLMLLGFSEIFEARDLLRQYGTIEFLRDFKPKVANDKRKLEIIEKTLYFIIKDQKEEFPNENMKENRDISNNPIIDIEDKDFSNEKTIRTEEKPKTDKKPLENRETTQKEAFKVFETELIFLQNSDFSQDFPDISENPPVLFEADEKYLFEMTVKLKFSDFSIIKSLLKVEIPNILRNFPLETFKFQADLINELLNLLMKLRENDEEILLENLTIEAFETFLRKIRRNIEKSTGNQEKITEKSLENNKEISNSHYRNCQTSTIFQLFHKILANSIKFLIKSNKTDKTPQFFSIISQEVLKILKSLKNPELLLNFSTEILKLFNAAAQYLELSLYCDSQYLGFLMIFREIFCLNNPNDIKSNCLSTLEISFNFLYNCCLKHLFPPESSQEVLIFAYLFSNPSKNLEKLRKLATSREILNEFMEKSRFSKQFEISDSLELAEIINKLTIALPAIGLYEKNTYLASLYIDAFLYTMTNINENPDFYEKTRDFLIKLSYSTIKTTFFAVFLQNFKENGLLLEKYLRKDLIFEAFMDPSLAVHMISQGIQEECGFFDILELFFKRFYAKNIRDSKKIRPHLSFFWEIEDLSKSQRKAKEICDFLLENDEFIKNNYDLLGLFHRNETKRRVFIENLKVYQKKGDFLSEFLDSKGKAWIYKENQDFSKEIIGKIENIEKILKIAFNENLDLRIRISALEQIVDFSAFLLRKELISNEILNEIKLFILETLRNIEKFIDNSQVLEIFLGKTLCLGNFLAENGLFYEYYEKIDRKTLNTLISSFFAITSLETRFQIIKFIEIQIFLEKCEIFRFFELNAKDFIETLQKNYYFLPNFRQNRGFQSKNSEFWLDFYPISENIGYYLENGHVSNEKAKITMENEDLLIISEKILEKEAFLNEELEENRLFAIKRLLKIAKNSCVNDEIMKNIEKIAAFINKRIISLFFEPTIQREKSGFFFNFLNMISFFRPFCSKTPFLIKKHLFSANFLNTLLQKSLETLKIDPKTTNFLIFSRFFNKNSLFLDFSPEKLESYIEILLSFPADSLYKSHEIKQKSLIFLNKSIEIPLEKSSESPMRKSSILSFLLKLSRNFNEKIRLLAWNLLYKVINPAILAQFQSILESLLEIFIENKETSQIKAFSVFFLSEILGFYIENQENPEVLRLFSEKSVISHINSLVKSKSLENLEFLAAIFRFLMKIAIFDYQNTINILMNLEIIEFSIEKLIIYSENPLLLSNFLDFLIFLFRKDPEIANFLMKSTELLTILWVLLEKPPFSAVSIEKIAALLNICLFLNEDLTIFSLNKVQNSNIFAFFLENMDFIEKKPIFLEILMILLYKFAKTSAFLNEKATNSNETLGERLLSEFYRLFRKKTCENGLILKAVAGLLALNYKCKRVFEETGFFTEILKEIKKELENLMVFTKNTSKNKRKNEVLYENMRVLRFFLLELEEKGEFIEEKNEFIEENAGFIDVLMKMMRVSLGNEDFMQEFAMLFVNLMNTSLFHKGFIGKTTIINEMVTQINKYETFPKNSMAAIMKMLSAAIENNEIRGLFIKMKTIESLTNKVSQIWIKSKDPDSRILQDLVSFLSKASFFKEFQPKIFPNTEIFEIYLDLFKLSNMTSFFSLPVLQILANTALHLEIKSLFTQNSRLLAMIVTILLSDKHSLYLRALSSQFIVNLVYKSTAGISCFKKEEVLEEIRFLVDEMERIIDRERMERGGEDKEKQELCGIIMENGRKVINVASVEWMD